MSIFDHLRPLIFVESFHVSEDAGQSMHARSEVASVEVVKFEDQVAGTITTVAAPQFPVAHQYSA